MENVLLTIALVVLFTLIGAGVAGYLAFSKGREAGTRGERERQEAARQGAEEHAARIIAEAETAAKQAQLAIKEEEVVRRKRWMSKPRDGAASWKRLKNGCKTAWIRSNAVCSRSKTANAS